MTAVERRSWIIFLEASTRVGVRTTGRPIEHYAVRLEIRLAERWRTIYLIDNAHGQHDAHPYAAFEKLRAQTFTVGSVDEALPAAIDLLSSEFERIISEWRARTP